MSEVSMKQSAAGGRSAYGDEGASSKRARGGLLDSRAGLFARAVVPDFVLCAALAFGVGYAVLSGFDATLSLRNDIGLQLGVVGVMLAVLFAGSWSKAARAVSVGCAVVLAVAITATALFLMPEGTGVFADGSLNDVEGNYLVFTTVELVVAVLAYALSRRPGSALFLAVASVFTCAVVQYLFRDWLSAEGGLTAFLVVLCAAFALAVYQRYRAGAASSDTLAVPAFGSAAISGIVVAVLCIGGAGLAYVGIVEPLGLGTPVLKPFEYRIVHPIVEYAGTYDQFMVEDPNKFSSLLSDKADETTQNTESGTDPQEDSSTEANNPLTQFVQSLTVFSDQSWTESFDAVTAEQAKWGALLAALAIVGVCALAIAARIRWRTVRLRRIERLSPAGQAVCLYEFFLSRFRRLKLGKPEQATPLEYAYDFRRKMVPFTRGTGKVDFLRVTLAYQRAAYGSGDVSEEDLSAMKRYYRAFFGNAHRYVGTLKWLWKFWKV